MKKILQSLPLILHIFTRRLLTRKRTIMQWEWNSFGIVMFAAGIGFALVILTEKIILPSIFAATTPWTQTNWNGGVSGGTVTSTVTTYESQTDIDTTIAGELSLDVGGNVLVNSSLNSESDLDNWLGVDPRTVSNVVFYVKADSGVYADAGSTLATNAQDVQQWNDISGNVQHATAPSAGRRPTYYTNQINGRPALNFEQLNDTANNDDVLDATISAVASFSDLSVFTVASFDYTDQPSNNYDYIYSLYNPANTSILAGSISRFAAGADVNKYYNYYNNGAYTGPVITSGFKLFSQQINNIAPRHYFWINRTTQSVATIPSQVTITSPKLTLGKWDNGTWALKGRIAEFLLFNNDIPTEDRHKVENYLNNKYNLGTSSLTHDTTTKYSGAGSAKVITGSNTSELLQAVNVGDTDTYTLEAYAYTDGSAVTSADAVLYYNGAVISTSYTSVGSGWYRLSGSLTGANENRVYGIQIKASKTVYVDDFSLTKYASSGTLTSNILNAEYAADWGILTYTTSGSGTVTVKVRSDANADMSTATAWGTCTGISSGTDLSGTACVSDTDQYLQYQITLQPSGGSTPVFENISIEFTASDAIPPPTNATGLAITGVTSGAWTAAEPTVTWTAGVDDIGGAGILGYCIALDEAVVGAPDNVNPATGADKLTGIDDGISNNTCPYIVSGTSINLSTISGLTLTSGKQYYISIKAVDMAGNVWTGASEDYQNLVSFKYDNTAPTNVAYISSPSTVYGSINDMTFSWPSGGGGASSDGHSGVLGWQYSLDGGTTWKGTETSALGFEYIPDDASTYSHNLTEGDDGDDIEVGVNTVYFRTVDVVGNFSAVNSYRTAPLEYGGSAPTFESSCSINSGISITPSTSTSNSYALNWNAATATGINTVARYYYMINISPPSTRSSLESNSTQYIPVTSTSVSAKSLTGAVKGTNTVYVVAVDSDDNYSQSNCVKGTFTLNSTLPDPVSSLSASDASIKSDELWRASITWGVPVYKGTGTLTYIIQRSTDNATWTQVTTTTGTSYTDTVSTSATYYYRVGTYDTTSESIASPTYSTSVSVYPKGTWDAAPTLSSGPTVTGITTKRATISWSTSRTGDSRVQYGTSSGSYFDEEPSKSDKVTSHEIKLTNLSPGTKYYYKVKWTDEDGNTGISTEKTFTTDPAPIVIEPRVTTIGLSSASLEYTVSGASKVKIYYGTTISYGAIKEVSTSTNETLYTTTLDELLDGTKYFYKINTVDSEGDEYEGNNLTFETLPRPRISNILIEEVKGTAQPTVLVSWETNTEVSSIITYYPSGKSSDARDEVSVTLKSGTHRMVLRGLINETRYEMQVKGRDKVGNEAISDIQIFTTATDTRPPQIENLKVEGSTNTLSTGANQQSHAQLVVSWDTDEPSTSQVEIGEGTGTTYAQRSQEDRNMTTNHIVILSSLTPSKVYHLRAISKDVAGNTGYSLDTVTITPKSTDSALDLVIGNLSEVFGFLRGL